MVENLIAGYLSTGKRLVVPELGAFLKKDTGEIVFVEFLKKDDGVLAAHVAGVHGLSALEAAAAVSKASSRIKTSLAEKGFCVIPSVGTLRRDATGAVSLTVNPAESEAEITATEKERATAAAPESPAKDKSEPHPSTFSGEEKTVRPAVQPAAVSHLEKPSPVTPAEQEPRAVSSLRPMVTGPHRTPSEQSTDPQPAPARRPAHGAAGQQKRKTDMVMVIAIVAALIAIGAMIFGLRVNNNPIENLRPTQPQVIEVPDTPEPEAEQ